MSRDPIVLVSEEKGWRTQVELDLNGGGITRYTSSSGDAQVDWLYAATAGGPVSFAMVPFCSRVEAGRFQFGGHQVALPANNPPEPHAIHGHGFQQLWQLDAASADRAAMSYVYPGGAWPWPYAARLEATLQGMNLRVCLTLENCSTEPMPCGLGMHPYFPDRADARVIARVSKWLQLDAAGMPLEVADVPAELSLSAGVKLGELALDHVFLGWDGVVEIVWDGASRRGLYMRASDVCEHLVVFAPADAGYFCVEPVANLPDGFNGPDIHEAAFQVLAPGQTLSAEFRFEPYGSV